jgi:hypothetical protein
VGADGAATEAGRYDEQDLEGALEGTWCSIAALLRWCGRLPLLLLLPLSIVDRFAPRGSIVDRSLRTLVATLEGIVGRSMAAPVALAAILGWGSVVRSLRSEGIDCFVRSFAQIGGDR